MQSDIGNMQMHGHQVTMLARQMHSEIQTVLTERSTLTAHTRSHTPLTEHLLLRLAERVFGAVVQAAAVLEVPAQAQQEVLGGHLSCAE